MYQIVGDANAGQLTNQSNKGESFGMIMDGGGCIITTTTGLKVLQGIDARANSPSGFLSDDHFYPFIRDRN